MLASARKAALSRVTSTVQRRFLSIHEYQSVELLNAYGIATPKSVAAHSPEEAFTVARDFGKDKLVIKAQVLAGGRGKGKFDNGLQGGVHLIDSPQQAKDYASQMLGSKLVTKQTGAAGKICNSVMLAERRTPSHEYYAAILNDRASQGPVLVTSRQGGMNIEEVAASDPSAIITTPIDHKLGLSASKARELADKLGFAQGNKEAAAKMFQDLYKIFKDKDATQIEINPLAETEDGHVLCMDAKFGFDDHAAFRQPDIFALRDTSQEAASEVEADKYGLNFIKLDGNIGCLVNGAGLAMATMDVLKLHGGDPANFLDVGGGATPDTVKKAFEILLSDKEVKTIFINIFGGASSSVVTRVHSVLIYPAGIMRCDYIAEGVIKATKELELTLPLIVRLQGTKEEEAKQLIKESGLKIFAYDDLDDAAEKAVEAALSGKPSL